MSSEFASLFAKMREKRREDEAKETVSDMFGDVDVSSPGKIRKFGSALFIVDVTPLRARDLLRRWKWKSMGLHDAPWSMDLTTMEMAMIWIK